MIAPNRAGVSIIALLSPASLSFSYPNNHPIPPRPARVPGRQIQNFPPAWTPVIYRPIATYFLPAAYREDSPRILPILAILPHPLPPRKAVVHS